VLLNFLISCHQVSPLEVAYVNNCSRTSLGGNVKSFFDTTFYCCAWQQVCTFTWMMVFHFFNINQMERCSWCGPITSWQNTASVWGLRKEVLAATGKLTSFVPTELVWGVLPFWNDFELTALSLTAFTGGLLPVWLEFHSSYLLGLWKVTICYPGIFCTASSAHMEVAVALPCEVS